MSLRFIGTVTAVAAAIWVLVDGEMIAQAAGLQPGLYTGWNRTPGAEGATNDMKCLPPAVSGDWQTLIPHMLGGRAGPGSATSVVCRVTHISRNGPYAVFQGTCEVIEQNTSSGPNLSFNGHGFFESTTSANFDVSLRIKNKNTGAWGNPRQSHTVIRRIGDCR